MLTTRINLAKPPNDDGIASRLAFIGLHGVIHMSCNVRGDIFWKDIYLQTVENAVDDEHFDHLQELGILCRNLERLGIPVNSSTAGSHRSWFKEMKSDEPYKALLSRCPEIYVGRDTLLIRFRRAACEFDGTHWLYYILGSRSWWHRWIFRNLKARGYRCQPLATCELSEVLDCLNHFGVPYDLLEAMAVNLNPRRKQ